MGTELWVGTHKGFFALRREASGGWRIDRTAFLGVPVSMVLHDGRSKRGVAALDHGHFGVKLHYSDDGGRSWEEGVAPAYPPKPDDVEDMDPMRHEPIPWDLKLIWSMEAGTDEQPGRLWCGTMPGGLFRSDDNGESWELVRSLWDHPKRREWFGGGADYPGVHSIVVNPAEPERIGIGISCGGFWASEDGGGTWDCRADGMWAAYMPPGEARNPNLQDPHRVVQCRERPDVLWAQHHNGIFRSEDGAGSWSEITGVSPSSFGFAVAVHPHDPDTTWFVPAVKDEVRIPVDGKVVVTRTRDGGRSFEALRNGLPQEHAYDLVFRHGLDITPDGESLAFGSTSGSLWISEDQGDRWETVSRHLPPVLCVRFVETG
jgi:hypothetical protein